MNSLKAETYPMLNKNLEKAVVKPKREKTLKNLILNYMINVYNTVALYIYMYNHFSLIEAHALKSMHLYMLHVHDCIHAVESV